MTELYSYLICSFPEAGKRSLFERLQQIVHKKISDGFYLIAESRIDQLRVSCEKELLLILRRVRSLIKPQLDDAKKIYQLGCLIVVAYRNLPKNPRVRKRLQRLLLRAPCFRLRKGIYAFPQLKSPGYQKFKKVLGPSRLADSVKNLGGEVSVVSRLTVIDKQSSERLLHEFKDRILKRMHKLSEKCKTIMRQVKLNEYSVIRLKKEVSEIKNNILSLKQVLFFVYRVLNLNFKREYRKVLNSYMRFRRIVNEVLLPSILI